MSSRAQDVVQIGISSFSVFGIHCQLCTSPDGIQGAPNVMRERDDNLFAYLQHFTVMQV